MQPEESGEDITILLVRVYRNSRNRRKKSAKGHIK